MPPAEVPLVPLADTPSLAAVIARDGVIAIPTESSYGLAARPTSARGVAAIFACKARGAGAALPVVAGDFEQLRALGIEEDDPGLALVRRWWPAPLTCVVPLRPGARAVPASAGSASLGVRLPAHAGLRGLLLALGGALTATSANRSGEPPLLHPAAVAALLLAARPGVPCAVADAGALPGGAPSTVVTWRAGRLVVLRDGAFPSERLTAH